MSNLDDYLKHRNITQEMLAEARIATIQKIEGCKDSPEEAISRSQQTEKTTEEDIC